MESLQSGTGLSWHPHREALFAELHSRPFQVIPSNARITQIATLGGAEVQALQWQHIGALLQQLGIKTEVVDGPCNVFELASLRIRWEKHLEFSTLTLTDVAPEDPHQAPFSQTALDRLPAGWIDQFPGSVVAAFHIHVADARDRALPLPEQVRPAFDNMRLVGGSPQSGDAQVWTSFQAHDGGFGRFLVFNRGMTDSQMGRMLQRLMEIEVYRLMALLGLMDARELAPKLARMDAQMADITQRLAANEIVDDAGLLREMTDLAAEIEAYRAKTTFRFNASMAYEEILDARLEELREDEVSGHMTLREFLIRRLKPAVRSCRTMQGRLDDLSLRVNRASDMMRTRVELSIQNQNSELLASMDRRSRIQLMMQHTVEGLSVAAISYYAVGLIKYLTDAVYSHGVPFNKSLVTGLSVPVVIAGVWLITRKIHKRFQALAEARADQQEGR